MNSSRLRNKVQNKNCSVHKILKVRLDQGDPLSRVSSCSRQQNANILMVPVSTNMDCYLMQLGSIHGLGMIISRWWGASCLQNVEISLVLVPGFVGFRAFFLETFHH